MSKPFDNNELVVAVGRLIDHRNWHGTREIDLLVKLKRLCREAELRPELAIEMIRLLVAIAASPVVTVPLFTSCARILRRLLNDDPASPVVQLPAILHDINDVIRLEATDWHPEVTAAIGYLGTNRTTNQTLTSAKDLASSMGLSGSQLGRLVRVDTGLTVSEWKWISGVHRGFPLVIHTTEQMAQIAFRSGYQHPEDFTRDFHTLFGVAPTDLRRRLRHLK